MSGPVIDRIRSRTEVAAQRRAELARLLAEQAYAAAEPDREQKARENKAWEIRFILIMDVVVVFVLVTLANFLK